MEMGSITETSGIREEKNSRIHAVSDELKIVNNYGFWAQGSEIKCK
jgi:hypothetical protein